MGLPTKLETLIEDFQYTMCEEPRDKIYGFLGLAHDCQDGSIQADYLKPLFGLLLSPTTSSRGVSK